MIRVELLTCIDLSKRFLFFSFDLNFSLPLRLTSLKLAFKDVLTSKIKTLVNFLIGEISVNRTTGPRVLVFVVVVVVFFPMMRPTYIFFPYSSLGLKDRLYYSRFSFIRKELNTPFNYNVFYRGVSIVTRELQVMQRRRQRQRQRKRYLKIELYFICTILLSDYFICSKAYLLCSRPNNRTVKTNDKSNVSE